MEPLPSTAMVTRLRPFNRREVNATNSVVLAIHTRRWLLSYFGFPPDTLVCIQRNWIGPGERRRKEIAFTQIKARPLLNCTAEAVATDIRYGIPLGRKVDITDGDYDDLEGAEVVMITSGINETTGGATDRNDPQGRLRLLERNAEIYRDVIPKIASAAPGRHCWS
jgi:hypothetical protein